jgi:nitrile hydratase subunit beta
LQHSYYENWLAGLEKLLVEKGLVTAAELTAGKSAGPASEDVRQRRLSAANVARAWEGTAATTTVGDAPRFQVGDPVRARNRHPLGHTREPGYVRGRLGVIAEHHGAHFFPDLGAQGIRLGRHLYSVRFEAQELWGTDQACKSAVYVDLWEDYLEAA